MEVTIMNPGVIAPATDNQQEKAVIIFQVEPSHAPRMNRTAKSAPKDLQAAWESNATAQMNMLMLLSLEPFNFGRL